MKKPYETPEIEIAVFEVEDLLAGTSGNLIDSDHLEFDDMQ